MNKNSVILIVDDEEVDTTVMRRALERTGGFTVLEARSYDAAVQTFDEKQDEIDLVVVDVSLPGRNGVDLARSFKRQRADLKVLLVSGWVGAEVLRTHGIPESERHFLAKPFRPADLVARVQSILGDSADGEWLGEDAGDGDGERTNN
jgi:two-component system cell cycle sensor histidine kinase/response regulator CckA